MAADVPGAASDIAANPTPPGPDDRPPPGFTYMPRAAFVNHVGPIYQAEGNEPGDMRLGLRVRPVHCNTMGFMHGGMAATLIDSAMARAQISLLKRRTVTLKMTVEYLDAIAVNDWLEVAARTTSHGPDVAHTEAEIRVDGAVRVKASGVFRLLRPLK